MARAFLVVMDSVGCGGAMDAHKFFNGDVPDTGANTLAHIARECAAGRANEGRSTLSATMRFMCFWRARNTVPIEPDPTRSRIS